MKKTFSGNLVQDVSTLSLGTAFGKIVTVTSLPILTRLYSPEDFALLAAYLAIVTTIAVAACLRLEIAIPLAENDEDAKHLLTLALVALTVTTSIVLVVVWIFRNLIVDLTLKPDFETYIWLVPFGVASVGFYTITQNWATRRRRFTLIAKTKVSQAVIGVSTSLSLGFVGIAPFGLLLGNILNVGAGSFYLARSFITKKYLIENKPVVNKLKQTLVKYKRFPAFTAPESLLNTAGVQIPIMVIATYAQVEAGFLMLAMQILAAPMSLLGQSIAQVYISRATKAFLEGSLGFFTKNIMFQLIKIGILPFILMGILAPWFVPYLFGNSWVRTGEVIIWVLPWIFLQFLVSPVSMVLLVTGRQTYSLMLQAFGLLLRVGAVLLAVQLLPNHLVETFALSSALFYAIYLYIVYKIAHVDTIMVRFPVN